MKTIKLPYQTNDDKFYNLLEELRKQYSSIVRFSFNRFHENIPQIKVRAKVKELNNVDKLNAWMQQCAIMEGSGLYTRFKHQPNIIFGSKKNFNLLAKGKITKEQYKKDRLKHLTLTGEATKQGNRNFILDIINNNQIIFKYNTKQRYNLQLPNLKKNIKTDLYKLQQLNNVINNKPGYTYSIGLSDTHIYISFEEFVNINDKQAYPNRYLGIDMNPENIGISIFEDRKLLHAQEFSLKQITQKFIDSNVASNSKEAKYFQNKLKFETIEISKQITKLANHYNCGSVFIEDLKFKKPVETTIKSNRGSKLGNRKCTNLWKRDLFKQNLSKRLNINNIKLYDVNPAYSSIVGNLQNDYVDSVNASIEIARRGYEYRIRKNKDSFYPPITIKSSIQHQWKEMGIGKVKTWKMLSKNIKNMKLKYRVSLDECKHSYNVFRLNQTNKSMVKNYVFYPTLI